MKKTYITSMPDHIGAFLKASECLASLDINITRVSYNKAIDTHTLFIDAEGTPEQLLKADERLKEIGYLHRNDATTNVVLIEFTLQDKPGSVTEVLKLINSFNFNISYISSQENGTPFQYFKMGLFINDTNKLTEFLAKAENYCRVRVIDYNHSEKVYDNTIFYTSFVNELVSTLALPSQIKDDLLVHTNLTMQVLDEKGLSPYKTFDSISKFAHLLADCRKENFAPRISTHTITDDTKIITIEPDCGSNTSIILSQGKCLFVDSGYALYENEMIALLKELVPDFEAQEKNIVVTHADVDHCGLLHLFDNIYASKKTAKCLALEYDNKDGYREQNHLHKPYIKICKLLTSYSPISPLKIKGVWGTEDRQDELFIHVGTFPFGELNFEVYEGKGGHLSGETVLIDYTHKTAFTGDIYVNVHNMTANQSKYNQYAPILMTSVDTDPATSAEERKALIKLLTVGNWQIFCGHGYKKDISVE